VANGFLASCVVFGACGMALGCSNSESAPGAASTPTLLTEPLGELPAKLSDVRLYNRAPQLDVSLPALPYVPAFPLWSDGGKKDRCIVLPEGTRIDASDERNYVFPVGTLIFKTFSFRTPQSPTEVVPVETRLLRLKDDGWELAAWSWDDAGLDAELLDLRRGATREVLSETGDVVGHAIPSRLECRQCHESSTSEVLGVNELQLHESLELGTLASKLSPQPSEPYAELPAHGPLTGSVLGYFVGNCVHCHNGSNGAASSFDLRPDAALENVVGVPTASSATADGIRVVPGKPNESILYLGVKGGRDLEVKDMPPLGVTLRDASAVELLNNWITALESDDDP
jgi:hypothetical protein